MSMSKVQPKRFHLKGYTTRLRVVRHFSSGIVERAKRERAWKLPHARKATRSVSPFLAWGDFHARSRFACSTIPEEKWGTTCSLLYHRLKVKTLLDSIIHRFEGRGHGKLTTLSLEWCISGAPYLRKFGNLSIPEILVIKWPYVCLSTPLGNQCEMSNFLASVGACNLCLTW